MRNLRNLIREINIMERRSYSLAYLKDKYEIQASIVKSRFERAREEDPESTETKTLSLASKLLSRISSELNNAYYQEENSKPWLP